MIAGQPTGAIVPPGDGALRGALVCMPFYVTAVPNAAIGLLRAIAERDGFSVDTYHLNLDLAARFEPRLYDALCHIHQHLLCEWLFAVAAFGREVPSEDSAYLAEAPGVRELVTSLGLGANDLGRLRHEVLPRYIDECAASIDWARYRFVGFTSSFQQNVASLALARRIKERSPSVAIAFGGANMDGEAAEEHLRAFPFIDYVVVGDGDRALPALLAAVASGQPPGDVPGLLTRTTTGPGQSAVPRPFEELDTLPTPDYDEFFARARTLGLAGRPDCGWALPFEGSRGCWWGEKHRCRFCSINGPRIAFRRKSPARVLDELAELAARHGVTSFSATDAVMDMRYVEELFDTIRETKTDYEFYYEVKANLTHEQIRTLYRGGVRCLQPGIESLSSHLLALMRKGTTMLQNVRCLKWSRYYGLDVTWNLLWGVPGEREEDYQRELDVLRLISHLQPPSQMSPVTLMRDSPYVTDPEGHPITGLRPLAAYRHVYPARVDARKAAIFFEAEIGDTVAPAVHDATAAWVEEWRRRWSSTPRDTLVYRRTPGALFVEDGRTGRPRGTHVFRQPAAAIYTECVETMRRPHDVWLRLASDDGAPRASEGEVRAAMDEFCRQGLMLGEDGRYLSLAIPANPNW